MTRCLGLNCPVQEKCRRYTPHNGTGAKDFEYVPKVGCDEFIYKPYSIDQFKKHGVSVKITKKGGI